MPWTAGSRECPLLVKVQTFLICLVSVVGAVLTRSADAPLRLSVYATAGDVRQHLATDECRARLWPLLERLRVSRVFLEGRRGDEYVAARDLAEVRDSLAARGIQTSGGIATVPGRDFGVRQSGGLDWLNWEAEKTRRDVGAFFSENARVFDELIVDDFFCTGDVSPDAERGRAGRSWSAYRRDLLVSLIDPIMARPARVARPNTRLIVKFPQWYDRFHVFGYDPPRMAAQFDQVWGGTEVRNPRTRRMGFVQPTQGYMNYRWLHSIAGRKMAGAWFDHIECGAQDFVNQAYMSVLAGARELTLFHLGDLVGEHPGDALLAERWRELVRVAGEIRGREARGITFYKPSGSDGGANLFLMDYLGMIGLPIVPVSAYPSSSRVVLLGGHAAADFEIESRVLRHLRAGATVVMTPDFVRRCSWASELAGVTARGEPGFGIFTGEASPSDAVRIEIDASLRGCGGSVLVELDTAGRSVPVLTRRRCERGQVLVLNVRTFSDADYSGTGEWLLPPRQLGWSGLPGEMANKLRAPLLEPFGIRLKAPAGVAFCIWGDREFFYNFHARPVEVVLDGRRVAIGPHQLRVAAR